ncbi:MAG: nucleotidyltransferase domain-containing protein [Candidatus Aminicenantes bacterium]|nr:nucleotidyltransferase domain-containing protein [Candidatus Aminicenantes bacterium]NIM79058.1 nucleotidyltransferase domain-containing protein [Candidatus Aminicenantes bacterium]NIN18337.1 nucleotidyltransferase domain-containing protein [Candidatus Aminicenantes bacterium]NIN42224.1 nucleotidyltransferase domain-containing protein [Candidatus Aminicenantes bacterium]NIN84990.1 nucleotidyltransferase domain-containing protein [Candidatus Aminicenantes bacterium]
MNMEPKYFQMSLAEKQQAVETIKNALMPKEEIKFAFVYGSFSDESSGSNLPFHDIDVGVYVTGMDEKESVYYGLEVSEELSSLVNVSVDVRVMNFAPVTFLFHVIRGQLIVDKDEDARCALMEDVTRRYLDMKPLLHRAIKEAYSS